MIIYKITNQTNNKSYIGFTEMTMNQRWLAHVNAADNGSQNHFHRAIRKYSANVWEFEILEQCEAREEAGNIEIELIAEHKTFENGYNSTTGGERGWDHTPETRRAISLSRKGRTWEEIYGAETAARLKIQRSIARKGVKLTEEHRKNISIGNMGRVGGFANKIHSESTRKQMSESAKGYIKSAEHCANIRRSKLGKRLGPQKRVTCPNCHKTGGALAMKRYHFDNCKRTTTE